VWPQPLLTKRLALMPCYDWRENMHVHAWFRYAYSGRVKGGVPHGKGAVTKTEPNGECTIFSCDTHLDGQWYGFVTGRQQFGAQAVFDIEYQHTDEGVG
jgi:hypothetical protein